MLYLGLSIFIERIHYVTDTLTQPVLTVVSDPSQFSITRSERCDSCGAEAFYKARFSTGVLFFCQHHYRKNETQLLNTAQTIIDESAKLKP